MDFRGKEPGPLNEEELREYNESTVGRSAVFIDLIAISIGNVSDDEGNPIVALLFNAGVHTPFGIIDTMFALPPRVMDELIKGLQGCKEAYQEKVVKNAN